MLSETFRRAMHCPKKRWAQGARLARTLVPAAFVVLSTAGCATTDEVRYGSVVATPAAYEASTYAVQQPFSLGEIIAALRAGRSSHELAGEIEAHGLLAPTTSADIDLLLQSGADAELIDAVREVSSRIGHEVFPSPPMMASPPIIVTPPAPLYPNYGWYPYSPYVPFSFGLWYHDAPRYRAPGYRPHYRPSDRRRYDSRDRHGVPAAPQDWRSPRLSPAPGAAPGTSRDRPIPGTRRGGRTAD